MTFKLCNLGSKQAYFISAYVVRVPIFSFMTVDFLTLGLNLSVFDSALFGCTIQEKVLMSISLRPYVGKFK